MSTITSTDSNQGWHPRAARTVPETAQDGEGLLALPVFSWEGVWVRRKMQPLFKNDILEFCSKSWSVVNVSKRESLPCRRSPIDKRKPPTASLPRPIPTPTSSYERDLWELRVFTPPLTLSKSKKELVETECEFLVGSKPDREGCTMGARLMPKGQCVQGNH